MSQIGLLIMSQQLLEVPTLCRHTCTKTATPRVNCFVNDALVHVMQTMKFSSLILSTREWLIICYLQRIFNINWKWRKQWVNKQNKLKLFVHLNWWFVSLNVHLPLENDNFYTINISQGSVAIHLRCGGISSNHYTRNLLTSLPVKDFW